MKQSLGNTIQEFGVESLGRFYSLYRGVVVDNNDPTHTNKLKIIVPSISPTPLNWAVPRSNQGDLGSGFKYVTPSISSIVFVEFLNGDIMYPVWSYHGWGLNETPKELQNRDSLGIITPSGNKIVIDDSESSLNISLIKDDKEVFSLSVVDGNISIKGESLNMLDSKFGIPLTDKLVDKINSVEKEINKLKQLFTSSLSQVKPSDGGSSVISYIASQFSTPLKETVIEDIENKKVKQ